MKAGEKMRYLNRKDQEMYNAIRLLVKLDKGEDVFLSLLKASDNHQEDADYWFFRALHTSEMLSKIGSQMEIFDYYEEILNSCETAINIDFQHWPAYYLRTLFSVLIQKEMENEDETIHYLLPCFRTPMELEDEVKVMIDIQKTEKSQPFFLMPYCMQALISLDNDKDEDAIEWISKGLAETKPSPILYLSSLLQIPFLQLYNRSQIRDEAIIKELKKRFSIMFSVNIDQVK